MGEVEKLTQLALLVCGADPADAEFNSDTLRETVLALLIRFPVYRSYGPDTGSDPARPPLVGDDARPRGGA